MDPLDFLVTQSASLPAYVPALFPAQKPVAAVDDDRFLTELDSAKNQMELLATTVSRLFHNVHEQPEPTHEALRAESELATQALIKLQVDTRSSYKKIRGMQNLEKAASALVKITFFDHEIDALIEKGRKTSTLLARTRHTEAVAAPQSRGGILTRLGTWYSSKPKIIMTDILALQKQYRAQLLDEPAENIDYSAIKAIEERIAAEEKDSSHQSLLLAELDEAKRALERPSAAKFELAAVRTLRDCLNHLSCTQGKLKSLQTLHATTKITKVVKGAIAALGKALLTYSSKGDPDYVKNRILFYLFFERTLDPELDYMLRDAREDDELIRLYNKATSNHSYIAELTLFREAVAALRREVYEKIDYILCYHRAYQLLADLKGSKLPQEHLVWLEKEVRAYAKEHDAHLNLENEFAKSTSKELFKPLIPALFSCRPEVKKVAIDELKRIQAQDGFVPPLPDTIIGKLYALWRG